MKSFEIDAVGRLATLVLTFDLHMPAIPFIATGATDSAIMIDSMAMNLVLSAMKMKFSMLTGVHPEVITVTSSSVKDLIV